MPKKFDNLFELIVSEANIDNAYKKTQKGDMKYKRGSLRFSQDVTMNLSALRRRIVSGEYAPSEYHCFRVYEPKERLIYAPAFEDKIVQHMINNILKDIYKPCFIYDSYSCIEGKGTHACVDRIQHFLRRAKRQYGPKAFIVKMDIRKFFYSMDREILKQLLRKKIRCSRTLRLLDSVIDSSPNAIGLPLGNLTSQLFANIYLNELDNFCKRKMQLKYYVRYADDMLAIVPSKEQANKALARVKGFIEQYLQLNLHSGKSKVFPLSQGVNAVGFKVYPTHRLLRNDCKKRIKRKLKKIPGLIHAEKMTTEKANQMVSSWSGHARHGNSYRFIQRLLQRFDLLFVDRKGVLRHGKPGEVYYSKGCEEGSCTLCGVFTYGQAFEVAGICEHCTKTYMWNKQ